MAADRQNSLGQILLPVLVDELSEPSNYDYLDEAQKYFELNCFHRKSDFSARIQDYVEVTVPTYTDPIFRSHFRMTRLSFQLLLELIGPEMSTKTVSLEKRTLSCLWYLSNTETFRSVADRFGMSKGSLHLFISQFCAVLTSPQVLQTYISFPAVDSFKSIADAFARRAGFPGVIGAIDGTHIPIPGPSVHRDSYICRKGFPSMQLQAICDTSLRFLDVYCAYPGSVHDARVFRNSFVFNHLENNPLPEEFHLIGDSAYPLHLDMMTPFRDDGHLTEERKRFNKSHSSTRVDIERAFGLLKGKFRKLKFVDVKVVKNIPRIVVACCVLHNFIIEKEKVIEDDICCDCVDANDVCSDVDGQQEKLNVTAACKRENICQLLA